MTFETEDTAIVTYSDHQAVVADGTGMVSTYTLDNRGYATACIRREMGGSTRTYTFEYLADTGNRRYLIRITERLDGGEVYSSLGMDYGDSEVLHFTQRDSEYLRDLRHLPCRTASVLHACRRRIRKVSG